MWNRKKPAKRFYRSRRTSYRKFASKVMSVVRNRSETKYVPSTLDAQFPSISTTWVEQVYGNIALGDDIFINRQGRKIAITGFYLNGVIQGGQINGALDDTDNTVRIVAGFSQVTTPMSSTGQLLSSFISTKTCQVLTRKIVDRTITLQSPGRDSVGYMPAIKHVKIYHAFKRPHIIEYGAVAGTSWSTIPFVSMISDSAVAPNPGFTSGQIRWIYKDI